MLRTGELLDPLKDLYHGASPVGPRLAAAVSYRAAWPLPEPDSHRLVDVSLHQSTRLSSPPPPSGVPLSGHAESGSTPSPVQPLVSRRRASSAETLHNQEIRKAIVAGVGGREGVRPKVVENSRERRSVSDLGVP